MTNHIVEKEMLIDKDTIIHLVKNDKNKENKESKGSNASNLKKTASQFFSESQKNQHPSSVEG